MNSKVNFVLDVVVVESRILTFRWCFVIELCDDIDELLAEEILDQTPVVDRIASSSNKRYVLVELSCDFRIATDIETFQDLHNFLGVVHFVSLVVVAMGGK